MRVIHPPALGTSCVLDCSCSGGPPLVAGVAGPVVVPLAPPTDGSASACVEVDRELALAILKHPADYYVNVHNAEFPAGAARGQLSK